MRHFRVVFRPDDREISVHQGVTILEAASQAGIILTAACGGKGTCGKCLVTLEPSGQDVRACQSAVEADLTVTVPAASRFYEHKILQDGLGNSRAIHPSVGRRYRAMAEEGRITGLAVDVGTTTVVAKLIDMADGRSLASAGMLNPQTQFGDDVISRITYAQSRAHLLELQKAIIDCINELTATLCRQAGIEASDIYEACIVGNTTMNHILLAFPVEQLGQAPYQAYSVDAHDRKPEELHLSMNQAGNIHTVENIAGFVGSDTTAVALAVDMDSVERTTLVVDIGTNGELVLGTHESLYAASCAAGPALEGARIKYGGRAAQGAIEAVVIADEDIALDVIGDTAPHSICGSGLIDAVAVLLDLGVVDATGRFATRTSLEGRLSEAILARMIEDDGQPAFCLAFDRENTRPAVVLTQKDIREMQLAKGAIRAGIRLLLNRLDLDESDLDSVLLAGAFGNYIRPANAVRIGLLPNVPLDRIRFVGNAAASGAQMLLLSDECRARAAKLARRIQYVEIAHEKDFADVFADAMLLEP